MATKPRRSKRDWKTDAELAGRLGVTERTIRRYRKQSGFPETGTVADVEAWVAARDGKGPLPAEKASGSDDSTSTVDGMSLPPAVVARRKKLALMRQAEEDARITEMERKEKEGELVATADVMSLWTRIATGLKNDLMNIGAQVRQKAAPLLRDPVDAGKIQDAIDETVRTEVDKAIAHGETTCRAKP